MKNFSLNKPYDSHVHLFATGELAAVPKLNQVQNLEDLKALKLQPLRGPWIYAFGWDENLFHQDFKLHRETLDKIFGETPVFLSRCDGHSSWLNTAGLQKLNLNNLNQESPRLFPKDSDGKPIGILRESLHIEALKRLPQWSPEQTKGFVLEAQKIFHLGGITHVREMTGLPFQLLLLQEMEKEERLELSVDFNFLCDKPEELDQLLNFISKNKSSQRVKIRGVKIFFDGSLGSETAFLSQAYSGTANHHGVTLWNLEQIKNAIQKIFSAQLEVCFHSIGDESTHILVKICREISQKGFLGRVNFEHVEVLRPETIQMMKPLHVRCHMQPIYWQTDKLWLKQKLGSLYEFVFPWEALRRAQIPLQFGSDTPIEPTGLLNNWQALKDSEQGHIPKFTGDFLKHHSCPYTDVFHSQVNFQDGKLQSLFIDEKRIL